MQNSKTEKQAIEEKAEWIVRNEIYTNCSYLISELVSNDKYMDELMEVCSQYVDNSEEIEELQDHISELEDMKNEAIDDLNDFIDDSDNGHTRDTAEDFYNDYLEAIDQSFDGTIEQLESEVEDLESEQDQPIEALEHWIVSSWLARKLEEHGQMVMDFNDLNIWGRTTSGQAIVMDYIMECIARELI